MDWLLEPLLTVHTTTHLNLAAPSAQQGHGFGVGGMVLNAVDRWSDWEIGDDGGVSAWARDAEDDALAAATLQVCGVWALCCHQNACSCSTTVCACAPGVVCGQNTLQGA